MQFRINKLCKDVSQYKEIIIYGTGTYAHAVYPELIKLGLRENIICFTQTSGVLPFSINGISVIQFDNINCNKKSCAVLIAVGALYTDEIRQNLLKAGYSNIIALVDYEWKNIDNEEILCGLKTFEEYCNHIANWYIETKIDKKQKEILVNRLLQRGKCGKTEKKLNQIIIICGHLSARIVKIIKALKQKKFEIVMLDYCKSENIWCLEALKETEIEIQKCQCVEEMLYYALQYNPMVYYFEPRWGDCSWSKIILKQKKYFGKIVLTRYDVLNDGYLKIAQRDLETEKYSLEHADGIIWRWFSKEYLEQKGFRFMGKSFQFIDYCSSEIQINEIRAINKNAFIVKFCAVIGYGDEYVEERSYETNYIDFARIGEILTKIGNRKDCIFHFYIGTLSDKNIEQCKLYEEQYSNFKYFLAVEHSSLLKKLQEYDFGCHLYTAGKTPENNIAVGDYSGSMYWNSIRNVYFDFIDAGLPIITTQSSKLWEYLSSYDIVIKMNLSEIDLDYLRQNKEEYKKRAAAARKELNINNHISKFISFLTEV